MPPELPSARKDDSPTWPTYAPTKRPTAACDSIACGYSSAASAVSSAATGENGHVTDSRGERSCIHDREPSGFNRPKRSNTMRGEARSTSAVAVATQLPQPMHIPDATMSAGLTLVGLAERAIEITHRL